MQRLDLRGERFGKLVAREYHHSTERGQAMWICECDCGNQHIASVGTLRSGKANSCGCLRRQVARANKTTHGMSGTPTYESWLKMRRRCTDSTCRQWKWYGALGVKVCARWRTFSSFLEDMGMRPDGTSLDRYPDPAGNYEPGNCRWATPVQQRLNQKRMRP